VPTRTVCNARRHLNAYIEARRDADGVRCTPARNAEQSGSIFENAVLRAAQSPMACVRWVRLSICRLDASGECSCAGWGAMVRRLRAGCSIPTVCGTARTLASVVRVTTHAAGSGCLKCHGRGPVPLSCAPQPGTRPFTDFTKP
jgi:hypothetical protein